MERVEKENDGLDVIVTIDGQIYNQDAKNVVHAWNGYGQSETFLPKRLYQQLTPEVNQATALQNSGISISKSVNYGEEDEIYTI